MNYELRITMLASSIKKPEVIGPTPGERPDDE